MRGESGAGGGAGEGLCEPNEAVAVKFLKMRMSRGRRRWRRSGWRRRSWRGNVTAKGAEVVNGDGTPAFRVYMMDGTMLKPKAGKVEVGADGAVVLDGLFPELKEAGTYVLAWKDARRW